MKPPGIRTTDGKDSCSSCVHYDSKKQYCNRYKERTKAFLVSDGFERAGKTGPTDPGERAFGEPDA